ncbi:MAG: response regulator [Minisyncoccia bacterium]
MSPKKICIVDDDAVLRDLLSEAFTQVGFEVTTLGDPTQFFETIKLNQPDVALFDIMMPGMTGLQLLERVRLSERCKEMPVAIMTNSMDMNNIAEAVMAGVTVFIQKAESTPEGIVARVQELMNKKQN